jgi:hypothetical protein
MKTMHALAALVAMIWSVPSGATSIPPEKVLVTNTSKKPVPTTEALARTPVLAIVFGNNYVVPDGKIVVLQTVSVRRGCPRVASNMVTLNVSPPSTPGFMFEINVPLTFGFSNVATNHIYSATQNVSVYLEAGTIVSLAGSGAGNCDGGGTPLVYLFGYSVPATSASLAP